MQYRVSIKRAGPEDAEAVRTLTRAAYAKWVPVIGREPLPMRVDYATAIQEHRIDLGTIDGEIVALIETVEKPDHLLIENVAVSPARQGRGLGHLLLEHAETLATALGLGEVRLYTNKEFAQNLAFYAKSGFVVDREEPFMGGTTVHMRKALPG